MTASDGEAAARGSATASAQTQGRRLAFAILVLGLLCAICAPFFVDLVDHDAPRVRSSLADYSDYGALERPVELAGEWGIIWRSGTQAGASATVRVPGDWEGKPSSAGPLPEQGAASYYVTLRGLQPGRYTLFLPSLFGATAVFVDGELVSQRGAPGVTAETTRSLVRSHAVTFRSDGSDVRLRIDMAAFHHRDNGLQVTPLLGGVDAMEHWITLDWIRSLLLMTSLLLLACYGAVVFLFRPQDRASLYFALSCLFLLPLIGVFGHDNLLLLAFPGLTFGPMLWLQYLTSLVSLALVLAYTHQLFPRESSRPLYLTLQGLMGALFATYLATGVLGDTLLLSKFSQTAIVLRLATILYILAVVVRASLRRRDGAVVFLLGMGMFAATLIYSDLMTNALIPRVIAFDILPVGMLLLLFSHIVILAERWSLAIKTAEHERNYNENILRSMSSGVVTFDAHGQLAKLNAAAVRILETTGEAFSGEEARAWLADTNPGLLAESEAVRASGEPKTLVESEIRTARGNLISANVSIVPLVEEGGEPGLMVIIEDITKGKRMQGAMRRFMTQRVVDQVMSQGELLFGVACRASVLFADIRNFSALAETLAPRETVDMLNEVFTELFEAVAANDGVLDKFLGDAVMAVYGAPVTSGRDAENAVKTAVAMMALVEALNARRRARGEDDLRLGVGVATGEVVAGTIGSPKRMDYTVIGDSVNLAARLQQVTKLYQVGIVVCETTAAAVAETAPLRELDMIRLRGRQQPEKVFQVLTGDPAAFTPALEPYRRGRDLMGRRRWREALAAFESAVEADPADHPSALMLERARILVRKPPSADWDGVWEHREAA